MTRGLFRPCNTGKYQGETETMKALETDGEVELSLPLSPASSCVQKKFPSENSEAIPSDQQPRCFFPFFSQFYGEAESFLICISLLYTFFLLISAPSLCSEARQKEEKHSARTDISLYVHLTYKNFNSENNSCRLLNTASDSSVTIVFSSIITNLEDSETGL